MWKLTARNAGRFATTRAKRMITPAERRAELDAQFAIRTTPEHVARELGSPRAAARQCPERQRDRRAQRQEDRREHRQHHVLDHVHPEQHRVVGGQG